MLKCFLCVFFFLFLSVAMISVNCLSVCLSVSSQNSVIHFVPLVSLRQFCQTFVRYRFYFPQNIVIFIHFFKFPFFAINLQVLQADLITYLTVDVEKMKTSSTAYAQLQQCGLTQLVDTIKHLTKHSIIKRTDGTQKQTLLYLQGIQQVSWLLTMVYDMIIKLMQ